MSELRKWSSPLSIMTMMMIILGMIAILSPASASSHSDLVARSMMKSLYSLASLAEIDLDSGSTSDGLLEELDQIQDRIRQECDENEDRYNTDLKESIQQLHEYQDQIQLIQDHINDLQNQSSTDQVHIATLQQSQGQLRARAVQAQDKITQLQADLERSTSTWKRQSDILNNIIAVDNKAITIITDLIEIIKKPTSDIDPTLTQILKLLSTSTSDDIRTRLAKIQADLDKYRGQGPNERLDTRTRLLNLVRQLLKDAQKDLASTKTMSTDLDKQYKDAQDTIKSNIGVEQRRLADIQAQIKETIEEINDDESDLDQIAAEIAELQSSLSDTDTLLQQLDDHIQDTKASQSGQQMVCIEYRQQLKAVRRYLQSHPPNALESACKPGEPDCPLCLVDENCPQGLQCSKYAICYNSSIGL